MNYFKKISSLLFVDKKKITKKFINLQNFVHDRCGNVIANSTSNQCSYDFLRTILLKRTTLHTPQLISVLFNKN